MINKNKIIDQLIKKLLVHNYSKQQITELINLQNKFNNFEDYLYYLLGLANQSIKNEETIFIEMAKSLNSYLNYLNETNTINYDFSNLNPNKLINSYELKLTKINVVDNQKFYTNELDQYFLILNDNDYEKLNDEVINLKLFNDESFLNSLKSHESYYVLINLNNDQYLYLNLFYPCDYHFIYQANYLMSESILLSINPHIELNAINALKTKLINDQQIIFNQFKNNIINDLESFGLINNKLKQIKCLCIFKHQLFAYLISKPEILKKINLKYPHLFDDNFNLSMLTPFLSFLDSTEFVTLVNDFNILLTPHISVNYKNDLFYVINEANISNEYKIKLFPSISGNDLNLDLNKQMFNTINHQTVIYLFCQKNNKYLYLGMYYAYELVKQDGAYFVKIKPIKFDHYINHYLYNKSRFSNNNYLNVFNKLLNLDDIQTTQVDIHEYYLNSMIKKEGWIKNQLLKSLFDNELNVYHTYLTKNLNYIFKIDLLINELINHKFKQLLHYKNLNLHCLAQQISVDKNLNDEQLINLTYFDNNQASYHEIINYLKSLLK